MIFQELKTNPDTIPLQYSLEDMIQRFSKWPEQTTTSPSGRHLGIYKALVNAHKYQIKTSHEVEIEESLQTNASNDKEDIFATNILRIINMLINIGVRNSAVLSRWKIVHNCFWKKYQANR